MYFRVKAATSGGNEPRASVLKDGAPGSGLGCDRRSDDLLVATLISGPFLRTQAAADI